jgi:protein-S-isoprenylcysteine O-methyltransferase Ste14
MDAIPVLILTLTIWVYWIGVGAMVLYVRTTNRAPAGIVPEVRSERRMWIVWVPLIIAWNILPDVARKGHYLLLAVPAGAMAHPLFSRLRWIAAVCAAACFLGTVVCWVRMGRSWRIGVLPSQDTALVTTGLYAHVRHPIYTLGILLALCSAVIVPTLPMMLVAALHVCLILLKVRNEERFLLAVHGAAYAAYCRRTGQFFPRRAGRGPWGSATNPSGPA